MCHTLRSVGGKIGINEGDFQGREAGERNGIPIRGNGFALLEIVGLEIPRKRSVVAGVANPLCRLARPGRRGFPPHPAALDQPSITMPRIPHKSSRETELLWEEPTRFRRNGKQWSPFARKREDPIRTMQMGSLIFSTPEGSERAFHSTRQVDLAVHVFGSIFDAPVGVEEVVAATVSC
jgi:hypothetical protein